MAAGKVTVSTSLRGPRWVVAFSRRRTGRVRSIGPRRHRKEIADSCPNIRERHLYALRDGTTRDKYIPEEIFPT